MEWMMNSKARTGLREYEELVRSAQDRKNGGTSRKRRQLMLVRYMCEWFMYLYEEQGWMKWRNMTAYLHEEDDS